MSRIALFCLALALLLAAGCGASQRQTWTLESVRGDCMTDRMCFDNQDEICQAYVDLLSKPYASAHECRLACESFPQREEIFVGNLGCKGFFEDTTDTCVEYCDDHFPH